MYELPFRSFKVFRRPREDKRRARSKQLPKRTSDPRIHEAILDLRQLEESPEDRQAWRESLLED